MRTLIALLILLVAGTGLAEEQLLMKAANDQDSKVDSLLLRLDEKGRPTHLLHRRSKGRESIYTPQNLAQGVVLRKQSGYDLLVLRTLKFDPESGAKIELRYLYSGVPPQEYRTLTLSLKKSGKLWSLFKSGESNPIKSLMFQANLASIFGVMQPVGIRAVKVLH